MKWIFKDGIPIYSQIVEQMKLHIASGAYKMGDKLPSVRDLAVEAGVNPNTMQRAFAELERDGLLHSERTRGRFITEEENVLGNMKKELGRNFIREMFENMKKLGMSNDEILEAVQNWSKEEN
ncbi:GntR family transcriptional regulator [Eubacterium minutum ATCC 700079]|nr:GntR family transcriptional regulator [Eubacterium minutum ATCC 700079]